MFPIGDDDSQVRISPIVTTALIVVNVLFFLIELNGGNEFIQRWSFIPSRFAEDPASNWPTIFTAMFMHGGWMHLFGNMLYLYIFGDNVEENFGHVKYLAFYLIAGIAATFAQFYFNPHSNIPNVGASGAIAGVLGAYLLLFPQARVDVLVARAVMSMPALIVIGFWFVLQLFSGVGSIAHTDETADAGGVAYMAHVGGFVAGLAIALLFRGRGGPPRTA
ncbi:MULTISPECIES: rhomboid family intramembrane serine protease [unclassified Hyphomicrobium]|uniref:rhomboid family intramembrane serine protease n=1 Tax=unclassified Hyphomicrobium TaxID=2619925 RepID=UPI000213D67A|nr:MULTISPECIES: rhomboid family intramembrane serine protease [unclassified Hyphomicrobium]CCB68109.1 Rhomboid family protein [Hyphomicrobium sp. MC1]